MGPIIWSVSKSGSKQEVVDYVKQTLVDEGLHGRAKAYILDAIEAGSGDNTHCAVSGSGHASHVSLSISCWTPSPEPTPAA